MGETTQEERDNIRRLWEAGGGVPIDVWRRALNDADRLANIERRVRELADRIESDAEPVLEDTECIVDELRAILDT